MQDVTKVVNWKYDRKFNEDEIKQLDKNLYLVYTRIGDKLVEPVKVNRITAEAIEGLKNGIVRDREKNNHTVIKRRGFNCPIFYFAAMKAELIPNNSGPRFNDYFCLFKDGDIDNCIPSNMILIKIEGIYKKIKKEISDKYILAQKKGSIKETQEAFFKEAMKTYNFPNAAIDSNLNDAWTQHPKGGKKPIPNFYHEPNSGDI